MQEVKKTKEDIRIPIIGKITLAIDGSENSFQACDLARILAKASGAKVEGCLRDPADLSFHRAVQRQPLRGAGRTEVCFEEK